MAFPIHFQCTNSELSQLTIARGEILFVLGANGTGKSSLMHVFAARNQGNVRKISAHRQTWMSSNTLDMTPQNKVQTEQSIAQNDIQPQSRYSDVYAQQRSSMVLFNLIDAENMRARKIAAAYDADEIDSYTAENAPIKEINDLLTLSNIPIKLSIGPNDSLMACKNGGALYSAAELSDGERNALQIAGSVLTAPANTLILIDEPERHLHRSIISPLLTQLFAKRPDCAFVIGTHEQTLPSANPTAKTLLIRSCSYTGQNVASWDADLLTGDAQIDDPLKRDLIGARRKILFVEGIDNSLDKPLYSLIFPKVSVVAKGSCVEVEKAVGGLATNDELHWVKAFGIVDADGFDEGAIERKRENGVFSVPYYSVEAIYYHPQMIKYLAILQASITGEDAAELNQKAVVQGIAAIRQDLDRLCEKAVKKAVEKEIQGQLPEGNTYLSGVDATITVDSAALMAARTAELTNALDGNNWKAVLDFCPIRESRACDSIAGALNFRSKEKYFEAVRQLLKTNSDALSFARSLFSDLYERIEQIGNSDSENND